MTTPTSHAAYRVYYDVLDRAMDSKRGIRLEFETEGEAYQYRVRLHTARKYDRQLNRESRSRDDPAYGLSDYDNLIVSIRSEDGVWYVYIVPESTPATIEELPT